MIFFLTIGCILLVSIGLMAMAALYFFQQGVKEHLDMLTGYNQAVAALTDHVIERRASSRRSGICE